MSTKPTFIVRRKFDGIKHIVYSCSIKKNDIEIDLDRDEFADFMAVLEGKRFQMDTIIKDNYVPDEILQCSTKNNESLHVFTYKEEKDLTNNQ